MKKKYYIVILGLLAFLVILTLVVTHGIDAFDESIYQWVTGNRPGWLDTFFKGFTHIGDTIPVIIVSIACLLAFRKWKSRWLLASSLAVTFAMNQIIKRIVMRPRPPLERRLVTQGGYSFPSGHTMMTVALYGILLYLCATKIKNKTLRITGIILLTILILLIGISRIYVGVHFPSDVIGGYLLSIALLIGDISFINYHFKGE